MAAPKFLAGFSKDVDWRPLHFVEPLSPLRSCNLCGVVPVRTALIQCGHSFCKLCYGRMLRGKHTCPLDDEAFDRSLTRDYVIGKAHVLVQKVRCQNWKHGCEYVGCVESAVAHVVEECAYHAIPCLKCGEEVLRTDIVDHYKGCQRASCSQQTASGAVQDAFAVDTITKASRDIQQSLKLLSDNQASLQHGINVLSQQAHATERKLRTMQETLARDTEHSVEKFENDRSIIIEALRGVNSKVATSAAHLEEKIDTKFRDLHRLVDVMNESFKKAGEVTSPARRDTKNLVPPPSEDSGVLLSKLSMLSDEVKTMNKKVNLIHSVVTCDSNVRYWHVEKFSAFKKQVEEKDFARKESEVFAIGGYSAKLEAHLRTENGVTRFGLFFILCKSPNDFLLLWPFRREFKLSLVHPKDEMKNKTQTTGSRYIVQHSKFFRRPLDIESGNAYNGYLHFCYLEDIEVNGFIYADAITVSVELS